MRFVNDLHVCASCRRPAVVMTGGLGRLERRCTRCGWREVGAYRAAEDPQARQEDVRELSELVEEMERIDAFAAALQADLILPEDF